MNPKFFIFFISTIYFFTIQSMEKELVKLTNSLSWTPLHAAISVGNLTSVKTLVTNCGAYIEEKTNDHRSPLILAAEHGKEEIAEFLIKKGAAISYTDNYGLSALHYACKNGPAHLIELLMDNNADDAIKDKKEKTPRDYAFENSDPTICVIMHSCIQKRINKQKEKEPFPLHRACKQGLVDDIEKLILDGACLDEIDKNGNSPLHYAASHTNPQVLETFLAAIRKKSEPVLQPIPAESLPITNAEAAASQNSENKLDDR